MRIQSCCFELSTGPIEAYLWQDFPPITKTWFESSDVHTMWVDSYLQLGQVKKTVCPSSADRVCLVV